MSVSLTNVQIERISDSLKCGGFEIPDDWDEETLARLVAIILESLDIEYAE